jgi:hypothetical protein
MRRWAGFVVLVVWVPLSLYYFRAAAVILTVLAVVLGLVLRALWRRVPRQLAGWWSRQWAIWNAPVVGVRRGRMVVAVASEPLSHRDGRELLRAEEFARAHALSHEQQLATVDTWEASQHVAARRARPITRTPRRPRGGLAGGRRSG